MQKILMSAKAIAHIVTMLFIPISIVGGMLYLLDISPSIEIELALRVITPVYMAITGTWLIRKHRITTFSAKAGVIILSGIAAIYGFDVTYLAGGFYMLPLLLGMRQSSELAWFIMAALWFILGITYVILFVGNFIQKKNSTE